MNLLKKRKITMPSIPREEGGPVSYADYPVIDLDTPTPPTAFAPKEPLPDYVTPRSEVPRVGELAAEAMIRDFEQTAKRIEHMGQELAGAGQRCALELVELSNKFKAMDDYIEKVIEHVNETAEALREEAKLVFVRIENTVVMTQEMRELSDNMRNKVLGEKPAVSLADPVSPTPTRIPSVDFDLVEQVEKELNKIQE